MTLDGQIARQRARRPTSKDAARAGARAGLLVGASVVAVMLMARLVPAELAAPDAARPWPQLAKVAVLSVLTCVVSGACIATGVAAMVRSRRRLAAWFRYRA
jgi:hypothetical protein